MSQFTVMPVASLSSKTPKLGAKAKPTTIESTLRTTCIVVKIEDSKVWVKPVAQAMSEVEAIEVTCLPLYYKYALQVGCKGIHQPLPTDKEVHAWQPSRHDANCIRLNADDSVYVPKA